MFLYLEVDAHKGLGLEDHEAASVIPSTIPYKVFEDFSTALHHIINHRRSSKAHPVSANQIHREFLTKSGKEFFLLYTIS